MATVFVAHIQSLRSQRYSAIRDGLAAQIIGMEQQIATTRSQIEAIEQQNAASATQTAAQADVAKQTAQVAVFSFLSSCRRSSLD